MQTNSAGKKIVITGVTRGLGRAMAHEFARLGHTVIGCGRSKDQIGTLKSELGSPHWFSVVDVASDAEVAEWAKQILGESGPPDLLINNAAVINKNSRLWEVSAEDFGRVLDVNVKGTVNVIRHLVPSMVKANKGVIVNFSSGWGRSTDAEVAPYCASKWAIEGLTQSLSQELPKGVGAVALNPGIIDTDMLRSCFGGSAGGYVSPEDWARTAVPFILKIGTKDNGKALTAP
jgi:NAD(P)-dependent dehydrogenase (short-subunit alcohol dehydrogenase family)